MRLRLSSRATVRSAPLLATGVLAALALAGGGTAGTQACKPDDAQVGTSIISTYCGPAKATLTYLGKTSTYKGGKCTRISGFFLRIGRKVRLGPKNPRLVSFEVSLYGAKDGTYEAFTVQWNGPASTGSIVRGELKLEKKLTRGSFSGRVITAGGKYRGTAHGTFVCG